MIALVADPLVEKRRAALSALNQAVHDFEVAVRTGKVIKAVQDGATRFPQWDRTQAAYFSLRALWVAPRNRSGWRRNPAYKPPLVAIQTPPMAGVRRPVTLPAKKVPKVIPELPSAVWLGQTEDFRTAFYGAADKDGKRRFDGVPGEVALLMRRYQALRAKWWRKTPEFRKYNREYMAEYRAKKKVAAIEVKPEPQNNVLHLPGMRRIPLPK